MEELIIIGSGCAGMSAAIYAARAGMSPLVLEGAQPGGLITTTSEVENFPAFPEAINGFDLVWKMREQAQKFGARVEAKTVERAELHSSPKRLFCEGGEILEARQVIVATGAKPRMTGAKNEMELYGGNGVSVCATCDGAFYRGMDVAVVGGGDSACEEALFLTRFCSSVKLIHRRDAFRASKIMADRVRENPKIELVMDSVVTEVLAGEDGKVCAVAVKNVKDGSTSQIACAAMFVAIGHKPSTDPFKGELEMDADGYLLPKAGSLVETAIAGVYVAGDCSDRNFRQAVTASAMGCMAAITASKFEG